MKKPSNQGVDRDDLRDKLIGLGDHSIRKSYYPALQKQMETLRERVDFAELIAEIGRGLTEETNLRSSLQRCSDALKSRTMAVFVRIWTLDAVGETLVLQASSGLHTHIDGTHSRLCYNSYPYKVGVIARNRMPLLTNEVVDNPLFHNQKWVREHGIVSFAGYPLVLQQQLVGVIALFAREPMNKPVLDILEAIAIQIAVGIERIRALDAYKEALGHVRQSHDMVDGILRSAADALLVIDDDHCIVHMNQAAEALLGISLATTIDMPVAQVIRDPALREYLAEIDGLIDPGEDYDLEMIDVARKEQRVIQARSARLSGASIGSGLVISLRDVTKDREVDRLKSEFISTAAHELRTPLATIMGFAELLHSENWSPEKQKEYLSYIIEKTSSLERIVDDLLDLSRIEAGRGLTLDYSRWQIGKTLRRIIDRYRSEYRNYHFRAELDEGLGEIHADQGKFVQILDNLIGNSIKYSPKNSEIVLKASGNDHSLTITVADQGIGMNETQLVSCFKKFYRADTSDTAVGGLGLGLCIVRNVIESHKGDIRIESQPGSGTVVTFTLPMACSLDPGEDK